jgi:hypothetical protein
MEPFTVISTPSNDFVDNYPLGDLKPSRAQVVQSIEEIIMVKEMTLKQEKITSTAAKLEALRLTFGVSISKCVLFLLIN